MLKIYGSMLCKDCIACREDLDRAGVKYEFLDFADDLAALKIFLAMRDREPVFDLAKENGAIGIPCIVDDQGNVMLNWEQYM